MCIPWRTLGIHQELVLFDNRIERTKEWITGYMTGKKYLYTERAHYMCPHMHFSILADFHTEFNCDRMRNGIHALKAAHPLLRSRIVEEEGCARVYYEECRNLEIPVTIKAMGDDWQKDYDAVSKTGWNVQKEALLKVFAYPTEDGTRILFLSHHLLCDGRGLLWLVQEFADFYAESKAPQVVDEMLMESVQDLPKGSDLSFINRGIIKGANQKWRNEKHKVNYEEYAAFEREFNSKQKMERRIQCVDEEELTKLLFSCKKTGVSLNDYLIAKMMLEENVEKVVIASDIRNRIKNYNIGALGNYATAFGVTIKKRPSEILELAKAVHGEVNRIRNTPQKEMLILSCYFHMDPELLDAVAISSLGSFQSTAGRFVGGKLFGYEKRKGYCITNLGRIESRVIKEAIFIPPASPANRKTWGVLTVNKKMRICSQRSRTIL